MWSRIGWDGVAIGVGWEGRGLSVWDGVVFGLVLWLGFLVNLILDWGLLSIFDWVGVVVEVPKPHIAHPVLD